MTVLVAVKNFGLPQDYRMQLQFSHSRFIFLLIIVLNTRDKKDQAIKNLVAHKKHFAEDLEYCRECFEYQIQNCSVFFERIQADDKFPIGQLFPLLSQISCKRNNNFIKLINTNEKLISKFLFNRKKTGKGRNTINELRREFSQQQRHLQGVQYAPAKTIEHFVKDLQKLLPDISEVTIWNYLVNNIQLLLFTILYERDFPVPKTQAVCGFTLYQQYAGEDLHAFVKADFVTKLEISKQLLEAAIKFSYGFNNYRLYITDLTADNIVYDRTYKRIYFIDLDTIFIVDSTKAIYETITHKHVYLECFGCFAYSATDIASHNVSDINIYLVCQFLREDLYKELTKGFLYPIPAEFSENFKLRQLLKKCVGCPDNICLERFTVAKELIQLFEDTLVQRKHM